MKATKNLRPPAFLKGLLETMYIILILALVGGVLVTLYLILFKSSGVTYTVLDHEVSYLDPTTVSLMLVQIGLELAFAYLIYSFRNLIREFYKEEIYTLTQINLLKKIGILIIGLSIGRAILSFIAEIVLNDSAKILLEIEFLDSFWFALALGLFFIFLSKIFQNARLMKEENELTV